MREKLLLIVNRATSGVSVADMEATVGLPCYAQIRSAGMLFVKATNEGRTVSRCTREKITQDFETLAAKLLGVPEAEPAKSSLRFFGRTDGARA